MNSDFYLDWCPRAIAGLGQDAYLWDNLKWRDKFIEHNQFLQKPIGEAELDKVTEIHCVYRLDGVFLIRIDWKDQATIEHDSKTPVSDASKTAEISNIEKNEKEVISRCISHFLKSQIGHTHIYNWDARSLLTGAQWKYFNLNPILLNEKSITKICGENTCGKDQLKNAARAESYQHVSYPAAAK